MKSNKPDTKLELMRKFISVLPEENLAKMLRAMMAEEASKAPRRIPTPPKK